MVTIVPKNKYEATLTFTCPACTQTKTLTLDVKDVKEARRHLEHDERCVACLMAEAKHQTAQANVEPVDFTRDELTFLDVLLANSDDRAPHRRASTTPGE